MKKAIVFAGGGSKGAYEYGVWKALRELGEEFELAVGTSIGSINAGFYVQDDFEAAGELWTEMNLDTVMNNGMNFEKSFNAMYEQRENIAPFLKTYFKDGAGADITPFLDCLKKYANEEKFFASPVDYALLTVRYQGMLPLEIMKKDIQPGYFVQWINASCACFPAFPRCEIDGQFYLDGGYYDNLPIATALRMGSDDITAVDLRRDATHPGYENHPYVKYLKPSRELGSFLCFEREVLDSLIALGYNDTMRAYGRYAGKRYFLDDAPEQKAARAGMARRFLRKLTAAELTHELTRRSVLNRGLRGGPYFEALAAYSEGAATADSIFLAALELALEKSGADDQMVYTAEEAANWLKSAYAEIRDVAIFDITAAASAIKKWGEEKGRGIFSDFKRSDPEPEDYIIALFMNVLFEE